MPLIHKKTKKDEIQVRGEDVYTTLANALRVFKEEGYLQDSPGAKKLLETFGKHERSGMLSISEEFVQRLIKKALEAKVAGTEFIGIKALVIDVQNEMMPTMAEASKSDFINKLARMEVGNLEEFRKQIVSDTEYLRRRIVQKRTKGTTKRRRIEPK